MAIDLLGKELTNIKRDFSLGYLVAVLWMKYDVTLAQMIQYT